MSKIFIVALVMEKVSEPKGSDNKYHEMSELAVNWCLLHELIFAWASEREVWLVHWGAEVRGVMEQAMRCLPPTRIHESVYPQGTKDYSTQAEEALSINEA